METHYLNSDFDLSLRPRPGKLQRPRLERQVRELSVQALLGAAAGDAVLLRAEVPEEFLAYLDGIDLPVPRLLQHPRVDPDGRMRPFGWSAEAMELNRLHREPVAHPPLPCIARVNSRSFARELEASLGGEAIRSAVVESIVELESFLSHAAEASEWVIKAEHGHAGMANRRLRRPRLEPADRRFVEERLAEDDRLIVEPWLARERDWCVVFRVPFEPSALRIHETVCTRDGALIGALFEPEGRGPPPLAETAERAAARLEGKGYFGAACFDGFSWRDGNVSRLRSLVDLNCRLSMSDGAYRLWRRLAPERTVYYRFFNRRKLDFPIEMARAAEALEPNRYDASQRRGIIIASPLRLGAGRDAWRPGKLALLLVGDGRAAVFELERWFRDRFEV